MQVRGLADPSGVAQYSGRNLQHNVVLVQLRVSSENTCDWPNSEYSAESSELAVWARPRRSQAVEGQPLV